LQIIKDTKEQLKNAPSFQPNLSIWQNGRNCNTQVLD